MTESQWLVSTDARKMLKYITRETPSVRLDGVYPSARKLRLFAFASYPSEPYIDWVAKYADKSGYFTSLQGAINSLSLEIGTDNSPPTLGAAERLRKADLMREVFGNPFRAPPGSFFKTHKRPNGQYIVNVPCLDPAFVTATVKTLVNQTYDEFDEKNMTLDPFRLSVLADELEYLGLDSLVGPMTADEDGKVTLRLPHPLLEHLRSGRTHYRGCWALDYILGVY